MHQRFRTKNTFAYAVVVPAMSYFAVFFYYPFLKNIYLMFMKYNFIAAPKFVGLKNIRKLFQDDYIFPAFRNTFTITFLSVPLMLCISLVVATLAFKLLIGRAFVRGGFFAAYIMPTIVAAIVFQVWFSVDAGYINNTLERTGLTRVPWLTEPFWAMAGIIIVTVWRFVGYYVVIFLAGLSSIDPQLYEAAMIDGANAVQRFFLITIPQLKAVIIFSTIISTISALRSYPIVVVLTGGGPYRSTETVLMYMFSQGFTSRNVGYAAVIAFILFLIILAITVLQLKLSKSYAETQ